METWNELLIAYPFLQIIQDSLIVCIPLAMLLGYTGIFFISSTSKILAVSRQRSVYDKYARQTAYAGLLLGWILLIGGRVWLYYQAPEAASDTLYGFMRESSWLLLSIGVLLVSIYYALWGVLKNMPVLLATIGMLGAVQNAVALAAILCTIRLAAATSSPDMSILALPDIFPDTWNDPLYSAACYTIPLFFGMAAAISACWLVIRRKRDDFGRDYYNVMLPFTCSWAKTAWGVLWLLLLASSALQFWQQFENGIINTEEIIVSCTRILFWLVPVLLWMMMARSKPPMRMGILAFIALLICILFILPYYLEITLI